MTGPELKDTIVRLGITQAEFCRLVGCQPPTMSRYVRGNLPVPQPLAALAALMRALHGRGDDAVALLRAARTDQPARLSAA